MLIIIANRTLIEGIGCRRRSMEVIKFDGYMEWKINCHE